MSYFLWATLIWKECLYPLQIKSLSDPFWRNSQSFACLCSLVAINPSNWDDPFRWDGGAHFWIISPWRHVSCWTRTVREVWDSVSSNACSPSHQNPPLLQKCRWEQFGFCQVHQDVIYEPQANLIHLVILHKTAEALKHASNPQTELRSSLKAPVISSCERTHWKSQPSNSESPPKNALSTSYSRHSAWKCWSGGEACTDLMSRRWHCRSKGLANYAKWDAETPDTRIYLLISFDRRLECLQSESGCAEVTWATVWTEGVT